MLESRAVVEMGRLLRHLVGDAGIHRSVVVNAVAAADHRGALRERAERKTEARLKPPLVPFTSELGSPTCADVTEQAVLGTAAAQTGVIEEKPGPTFRFTMRP